jgi:hypothetical protein
MLLSHLLIAQNSNVVKKTIKYQPDTITFDTVSVYRFNFKIFVNDQELNTTE